MPELYELKDIPIENIYQKENIRKNYLEIDELAENILQYGLLQPITVYPENDKYIIKFGNRRFLALKKLNQMNNEHFKIITCIVSNSENIILDQLIENVQRIDISPKELCNVLSTMRKEGLQLKEIAMVMGKSEGYVKNLFVVINELEKDNDLKEYFYGNGAVTMLDIKEIISVKDKNQRENLLEKRRKGELSQKALRNEIKLLKTHNVNKNIDETKNNKIHININKLSDNTGFTISLGNVYSEPILNTIKEKLLKLIESNNFLIENR